MELAAEAVLQVSFDCSFGSKIRPISLTHLTWVDPPSTSSTGNNSRKDGGGLSTGAKAGIGIGAGLGAILIAVMAWLLYRLGPSSQPRSPSLTQFTHMDSFSSRTQGVDDDADRRTSVDVYEVGSVVNPVHPRP